MTLRRRLIPVAGLALTIAALTSCTNGGGAGGATEITADADVTGEAVALATEQEALCEQIVAQGLPADAASALAEASGYSYVVVESGQDAGATAGTVVFTSADGIVVDCSVA